MALPKRPGATGKAAARAHPPPGPAQSRTEGAQAAPAVYDEPQSGDRSERWVGRAAMGVSGSEPLTGQERGGGENQEAGDRATRD